MLNQKKQKLDLESDGTIILSSSQSLFQEKAGISKEANYTDLYIENKG